jgi:type I restriction enzyme, S subunit
VSGWPAIPFEEAIADESAGNVKTPSTEFKSAGRFAIVDQGKDLISGYSDDETRVCKSKLPAIVFGDHTRCFKFIDFAFCLGADGVKVLRPVIDADVKYLYYFLRQIRLHDGGYDRHFKYLKRERIVLPPLPEQKRIAEILDRAEALRAKRRAALAQLDTLTQSIFLDLFGGRVVRQWPTTTLGETAEIITGYPFRSDEYVTSGKSIRLCRGANILPGRIDWSDLAQWPQTKSPDLVEFNLQIGDVLIAMDRPWISEGFKIARVKPTDCPALLVQRVARLRGQNGMPTEYLFQLLNQPDFTRHCRPTETTIPHISPKDIRSFSFQLPPITIQHEFARQAAAVEKLKTAHRKSLAELDALFASLQHRAFRGEL